MMNYSVAIAEPLDTALQDNLLQHLRQGRKQEDLCFGLWRPSQGSERMTALLCEMIPPRDGERILRGNVSFTAAYIERAVSCARAANAGVALLHSHVGPGWQDVSGDDVEAERGRAALVLAGTGLPLVGLTLGTDGTWSARFWPRTAPKTYQLEWCSTVRVVGKRLRVSFHPRLRPPPRYRDELRRTASVWGDVSQAHLTRAHVGIVGLGSVGRLVAEALARMGVEEVTFIDFDRVERHNLDRLLGAFLPDADQHRLKVEVAREGYLHAANAASPKVRALPASVAEPVGYRAALDCDVLFSCVDRPWGRRVLNHLTYAHLIPVIDGGILVRMKGGVFRGVEWSLRTAGPGRACLSCAGAYDPSAVDLERRGVLDDPTYIQGLDSDHPLRRNENIFPFSMSLAAHEVLHFIALLTGLRNLPDLGEQRYHYNLREMKVEDLACRDYCEFPKLVATGDSVYAEAAITGVHQAAERARAGWL